MLYLEYSLKLENKIAKAFHFHYGGLFCEFTLMSAASQTIFGSYHILNN